MTSLTTSREQPPTFLSGEEIAAGKRAQIRLLDDKAEALSRQGLLKDQIDKLREALAIVESMHGRKDPKFIFR
jgi:hypothetical protein